MKYNMYLIEIFLIFYDFYTQKQPIIINSVSVEVLHKHTETIRTCSTGHERSIYVNTLGGRWTDRQKGTHIHAHTHIYKHCRQKQFQKTVVHRLKAGMRMV